MMLFASRVNRTWLLVLGSLLVVYLTYIIFLGDRYPLSKYVPLGLTGQKPSEAESGLSPSGEMENPNHDDLVDTISKPSATTSTILSYPSDYLNQSTDDEWCKARFGSDYLDYLATHHVPYCESSSLSSFECFRSIDSDTFCVARGVILDHNRPEGQKATAIDCKMRNFTEEKMQSPEAAAALEGVKNVEDMGSYFFDTGVMEQMKDWDLNSAEQSNETRLLCDAQNNDHKWTLMVKREGNGNIWHKLMELWQSMITLDVLQMSIDPATSKPYLSRADLSNVQIMYEDDWDGVYDTWWPMLTPGGPQPVRKSTSGPACLGNVILPLAGSSSTFWQSHWGDQDCHESFLIGGFLKRVFRHLGFEYARHGNEAETTITFLDRRGETRKLFNLEGRVEKLRTRWPGFKFQVVDFATLPLKEQVYTIHKSDVIVGVTGAAMTHMLWLPEESSVVEIMMPDFHYSGFRNLAKMKKLHYYTTHSLNITAMGETHEDWLAHEGIQDLPSDQVEERNWQSEPWLYLTDEQFQTVVDAAIWGQLNRGFKTADVMPMSMS